MTTQQPGPNENPDDEVALSPKDASGSRTAKAAAVFTIGNALPRALGLVLLPVYTSVLAPSEYGALSVLLAVAAAGAFALSFGLEFAIFRTYFGLDTEEDRADYVATVWQFLAVAAPAAAVILYVALSTAIDSPLFEDEDLALAIAGCALQVVATVVPLSVLRARQALGRFAIFTTASAVLTTSAILLFVVGLSDGVRGWLIAVVIANFATFVIGLLVVPYARPRTRNPALIRESVALGVPMVPHFLAHWGLQLADRAVLAGLVVASQLGVYSLASNLAVPALIIVQAINQALMPAYGRAAHDPTLRAQLGSTMFLQSVAVLVVTSSLAFVLPPVVNIVAPSEYAGAADLVPLLVLGYGFLGLYYIPMNLIGLVRGQPRWIWVYTVACALLNVGLLYLFVPTHGLTAAALASALGYAALFITILAYAHVTGRRQNEPQINFATRRFGVLAAAAIGYYVAGTELLDHENVVDLALRTLFQIVGVVALLALIPETRRYLPRFRKASPATP